MFLTRFEVNRARRGARQLITSPQAMHAGILAAFPSQDAAAPDGRVLWRLDDTNRGLWLYLLSPTEPDLTHLVEQAGWPTSRAWTTRDYRPLLDSLTSGQRWAFRLTANVTRSGRLTDTAPKTQRFGHITAEQQRNWLLSRTERAGFAVPTTESHQPDLLVRNRIVRRFARHGQTITLSTATFDGVLTVRDADALRSALTRGLGPAKAYGCGLLTLAPIEPR